MSPCSRSVLSPDAPLFVPQAPPLPQPAPTLFPSYVPPPADLTLPPQMGLPCPFMGSPPLPGFASPFQCLPPPPGFPCPVQGPSPPPGFSNPFLGPPPPPKFLVCAPAPWAFPQGPGVGLPPPPPMPHDMMARPPAPAVMQHAAQPQPAHLPAAQNDRDNPAAGSRRTWRVASGRRPKQLRAAAKRAPVTGSVAVGDGAHGGAFGDAPSPRSVLRGASTSPPGSPRVLPAGFPYPAPAPTSPPAWAGHVLACKPYRRAGRRSGGQPVPPLPASCGVRCLYQQPRRRFDPASCLTTLMIRNIPNGFTRQKVMNILDQHCAEENAEIAVSGGVKSEYDFLYVPFDFKTQANKGYCFVNVTSPDAALRLWTHLHGYRWKVNDSRKTCEVDYATIQGREPLVKHFSGSFFECDTDDLLPVWFRPPRDGTRPAVVERHVVGRLGRRL